MGFRDNPEYHECLARATRIRWSDREFREKASAINREVGLRPEERLARSERAKKLWENPAYRAKWKASRLLRKERLANASRMNEVNKLGDDV